MMEPVKRVVGHRIEGNPIEDARIFQHTVNELRGYGGALVPKGVYRFKSFEEADEWMLKQMVSTRVYLSSKTS